jgi:hypothetical protein
MMSDGTHAVPGMMAITTAMVAVEDMIGRDQDRVRRMDDIVMGTVGEMSGGADTVMMIDGVNMRTATVIARDVRARRAKVARRRR